MYLEVFLPVTNELNFFKMLPIKQFKHIFVFHVDSSVRLVARKNSHWYARLKIYSVVFLY